MSELLNGWSLRLDPDPDDPAWIRVGLRTFSPLAGRPLGQYRDDVAAARAHAYACAALIGWLARRPPPPDDRRLLRELVRVREAGTTTAQRRLWLGGGQWRDLADPEPGHTRIQARCHAPAGLCGHYRGASAVRIALAICAAYLQTRGDLRIPQDLIDGTRPLAPAELDA